MTYATTLKAIATAALDYHSRGMLGYQNPENREANLCRYLYPDGRRCAIGAGLPLETAEAITRWENRLGVDVVFAVGDLLNDRTIEITDDYSHMPGNGSRMSAELQGAHDDLVVDCLDDDERFIREAKLAYLLTELAAGRKPMGGDILAAQERAASEFSRNNPGYGDDE